MNDTAVFDIGLTAWC